MARYIDAEKFEKDITGKAKMLNGKTYFECDFVYETLWNAPTADVVEVVRCKDCKYFGKDMGYGKHDCRKYEMPYCLENDFCSYGEPK